MAIALVQQKTAASTGAASASPTLDAPPAAGSLLVVTQIGNANRITAISGYGVTTWAVAKQAAFGNYAADVWYGIVDATPSASGTITLGATTFLAISVSEWSGIDAANPLLAQSDADWSTGTSPATGPITASDSPCLYVSVLAVSGGVTASSPTGSFTGLTVANAGSVMRNYSAYRVDSTAASATSGWTLGSSVQWEMAVAAFKGAVASPAPSGVPSASLASLRTLRALSL